MAQIAEQKTEVYIAAENSDAVTPSDTTLWDRAWNIYIGGEGTVVAFNALGQAVDYGTVSAEKILVGKCRGIKSTGTTATSIVRFL